MLTQEPLVRHKRAGRYSSIFEANGFATFNNLSARLERFSVGMSLGQRSKKQAIFNPKSSNQMRTALEVLE
jgi:hypothetical protein